MRRHRWLPLAGALALLSGLLLLPLAVWAAPVSQTTNPPPTVIDDTLENMTYISEYTESGEVTLEDGIYNDADNMIYVMLANAPRASGDLDGDGDLDAAVWMATNTGGSGVFVDLAAVVDVEGEATNVAIAFLGDRTQIQAIEIGEDGVITVRMIAHGDEDPMCCPTQNIEATYSLEGDELVELSYEVATLEESDATTPATGESSDAVTATPAATSAPVAVATPNPNATPWANPFDEGVLENATYRTEFFESGEVTLEDGEFNDDVNRIYYQLLPEPQAFGDLDGDGDGDAAVLLAGNFGGSGVFVSLNAVLNEEGAANNAAALVLGDRVQPQSLEITWDGVIVLEMIRHDADDPMCCPTEHVTLRYVLEGDQLVTAPEHAPVAVDAEGTPLEPGVGNVNLFAPSSDPQVATLALDPASSLVPHPAIVAVVPGPGDETAVDALYLATGCEGWVSTTPDVVVNLASNQDELRFFTVGAGDPTLLVVTPDGDILCNDDVIPEAFNALVAVENARAGRYAVYAGVWDIAAAPVTSLLVVTTYPFDSENYSVTISAPEPPAPGEADTGADPNADFAGDSITSTVVLAADDMPYAVDADAGGEVSIFARDLGNTLCVGWTTAAPALAFTLDAEEGNDEALVIFYEGSVDTSLIVRDPNGDYLCADDSAADTNWNPWMDIDFAPGDYAVWVGTYNQGATSPGTLTVTNDTAAVPAMLEKR